MAGEVVIRAERLGKKYLVGHESERERYSALRDALARSARTLWRKTADMVRGWPLVLGDTVEEFWALKDLSFEVKSGEVLGIIGRNGAGKTTLLKILSRITEPSTGRVTIKGRVASLLEVGTGFHPELTGRENIYLNGAILGMSRAEIRRKFDEIVDFAEVERFLDTPVKRYSSGMSVRLAFAIAAHLEPEILFIDEVLAVGDAEFQKKCLGKMSEVAGGGRTVLFVSHQLNSVERLCRRVLWLERGRLQGVFPRAREGISRYLAASVPEREGSVWLSRGGDFDNAYFRPERLEVGSAGGQSESGLVLDGRPIEVRVTGLVRRADPALNVGIAVYDESDQLLFWSFSSDQPQNHWPRLAPGPVRLRVALPGRLLNEGTYHVELLASLHYREWILEPRKGVPTVTFSIRGGLSDSPYWYAKRDGILAPVLAWEELPAIEPVDLALTS